MITFPSWVEGTGRNAPNAAELARHSPITWRTHQNDYFPILG
nr:MAG TPA: hypothetical protein [Caudoviricetes sp.]